MNWKTRSTANAKSRRVSDKCWSEPTVLRYRDGSLIGSPVNADKTEDDDIRDVIGFASTMLVLYIGL
jgi:hypothetical protein